MKRIWPIDSFRDVFYSYAKRKFQSCKENDIAEIEELIYLFQ